MWAILRDPCDENIIRSQSEVAPSGKSRGRWVLAVTILASSMAFIDGTVVNVALPALQRNLNATAVDVQWVIEAYSLLLSALLLVGGSLGDHYGRRKIFLIGVGVFALASAACGFAASIQQLIISRAIQGFGAALLVPGSLAIISNSFSERERGRAIGTWSGFSAITTGAGPVLGGWLIEHVSWRAVFFINVPIAVVVVLISLRHVGESSNEEKTKVDWIGAVLAALGLGALVYGLIESSQLGFGDPTVIVSMSVATVLLIVFRSFRTRVSDPMLPLTLFRIPPVYWNKSSDLSAVRCTRRNAFLSADELDSNSALRRNRRRRGAAAVYSAYVCAFSVVRRFGRAIWTTASANCRTAGRGMWFRTLLAPGNWRQLLDGFLSAGRSARPGNGH